MLIPFVFKSPAFAISRTKAEMFLAEMPFFNKKSIVAFPKWPVAPVIKIMVFVLMSNKSDTKLRTFAIL